MSQMRNKRLHNELLQSQAGLPEGITAEPVNHNDISLWKATIVGPEGCPYEGGIFSLEMKFPNDYPLEPPQVLMKTRIYHMNISSSGYICLDILKRHEAWSPAMTASSILLSVQQLLVEPNPDSPLVASIAALHASNKARHDELAKKWTQKFAKGPSS